MVALGFLELQDGVDDFHVVESPDKTDESQHVAVFCLAHVLDARTLHVGVAARKSGRTDGSGAGRHHAGAIAVSRWGVAEGREVYMRRRRWGFDGHLAVG